MQVASMHFKARAHDKLNDALLQANLRKMQGKFVANRRSAITELDDFEMTRDAGRDIRQGVLDDLDGWLLMFDEVQCGMGRTGRWFAFEHSGLTPDIVVMAKGLASGMPLSAIASRRELMEDRRREARRELLRHPAHQVREILAHAAPLRHHLRQPAGIETSQP